MKRVIGLCYFQDAHGKETEKLRLNLEFRIFVKASCRSAYFSGLGQFFANGVALGGAKVVKGQKTETASKCRVVR